MRLFCPLRLALVVVMAGTSFAGQLEVCDPAAAGFDPQKLAAIVPAMEQHVEEGKLVGGLGLVARGEKIVFARTWGQRDRERQLPLTEDTIFRIYSMTKPITSVGAMILVEEGKEKPLEHPIVDPFWRAFYDALGKYKS